MMFLPNNRPEGDAPYNRMHVAAATLDVMLYPLIHLHAEASWLETTQRGPKRTRRQFEEMEEDRNNSDFTVDGSSIRKYYSHRLQIRRNENGVLLNARALFLQWLIDAAVKIIDSNLNFAKANQDILEVCRYSSLKKFIEDQAQRRNKHPGRIVVIPKGEWKSERRLHIEYLDAVCISIEFGAPTFFITFTANPYWPEIEEELVNNGLTRDDWIYRPDITTRVFLAKRHLFLSHLVNSSVLGRCMASVVVDEFQKSGLAHSHIALILNPCDIPAESSELDRIISAEIPPPEEDPVLHELVMTYMIHKPCDGTCSRNQDPYCRKASTGKCKHGFPFRLRQTSTQDDKRIQYRRRLGPKYHHRGYGCLVDNSWVTPYNPRLLKAFQCHINVLRCATGILFKYIYSYMDKMKQGDTVATSLYKYSIERSTGDRLHWDEIEHFVAMRYVAPYEAVYRIYGVPFGRHSHTVYTLPIHLPDEHLVYYHPHQLNGPEAAAERPPNTELLGWFKLNAASSPDDKSTRLYADIRKTHE